MGTALNHKGEPILRKVSLMCRDYFMDGKVLVSRNPLTLSTAKPSHLLITMGANYNQGATGFQKRELFLLSFMGFAFVHVTYKSNGRGVASLGLDTASFDDFDRHFDRYRATLRQGTILGTLETSHRTSLVLLASQLSLPHQTYLCYVADNHIKQDVSTLLFDYTGVESHLGKALLASSLHPCDKAERMKVLKSAPLTLRGSKVWTVFDAVEENLRYGRVWYVGLSALADLKRLKGKAVFYGNPGEFLHDLAHTLETEGIVKMSKEDIAMEQQIRRRMRGMVVSIFQNKQSWDKALEIVVKLNLKRAVNRETLMRALRTIMEKSSRSFTESEMAYIESLSPTLARETLIIGAMMTKDKEPEPIPGASKTAPTKTTEHSTLATD